MNDHDVSDPIDSMRKLGKLIPPNGDPKKRNLTPQKALSCEEVLEYLPDFCKCKLGRYELVLMKIKKHLEESVSNGCGCAEKFSELNKLE